jgi:gluconolactonase
VHRYEIVVDGVVFGEGPYWCSDETLVCTSVAGGCLYRIDPEAGRADVMAVTDGGPNSCVGAADGGFLITQNGGIDFSIFKLPGFGELPPYKPVQPGLQYVSPSGECRYVATATVDGSPMRGPNDLIVAADGAVYFTDPGHYPLPARPSGRVMKLDRQGEVSVIADDLTYCNGIALDPDGSLVIVERRGLMRLDGDGQGDWIVEELGASPGDGFCLDSEGNYYVCCSTEQCIRVIDHDGKQLEVLEIDGPGLVTNCCFGGADGRSLFATDAIPGNLLVWTGLPHAGLLVHQWPGL